MFLYQNISANANWKIEFCVNMRYPRRFKIVKFRGRNESEKIYRDAKIQGTSFLSSSAEFTREGLWPSEIFHRKTQEQIIELERNERGTISNNVFIVAHTRRMHIHPKNFRYQRPFLPILSRASHCCHYYSFFFYVPIKRNALFVL